MSVILNCEWCGKLFQPSRADAHFHSSACKQAYWRWKHRVDREYAAAYAAISEIEQYLENNATKQHAENLLGQLADRLHAMGFEHDVEQLPLPVESYTITNQLGG